MSERPPQQGRVSWVAWGLALVSAAYLAWLLVFSTGQADDAEAAGYVIGTLLGALLIALVVRFIYVRLRPAETRPAFWSPWIIVLTAVVLILSRVPDALDRLA